MSFSINYSVTAKQDLKNIYSYIAYELLSPQTAAEQTQRIMTNIRSLDELPMRYPIYKDEPWYSMGIRFFPVDNYLIFYLPDEIANIVYIIRIMYSGRDIHSEIDGSNNVYT